MSKLWDRAAGDYSTEIFNIVKPVLENILNCKVINCEGSKLDLENCIDACLIDNNGNKTDGIAFRAQRKLYKTFSIRYKQAFDKKAKTEYDKLMNPNIKIKPKYHVQVFDAGEFYVMAISLTSDIIDYMLINNLNIITNFDTSQFIAIPWRDLKTQGYDIKAYKIAK